MEDLEDVTVRRANSTILWICSIVLKENPEHAYASLDNVPVVDGCTLSTQFQHSAFRTWLFRRAVIWAQGKETDHQSKWGSDMKYQIYLAVMNSTFNAQNMFLVAINRLRLRIIPAKLRLPETRIQNHSQEENDPSPPSVCCLLCGTRWPAPFDGKSC